MASYQDVEFADPLFGWYPQPPVFTRFMIISDTHSFKFGDAEPVNGKFKHPLPKCDVLLHCGDLTHRGGLDEYRDCIEMLGSIEAEYKLVIAGNHDRTLDRQYWATHAKQHEKRDHMEAVEIWTGPEAKEAGITYLEEGTSLFKLKNGSQFTIYSSPYQPEFCDWAFPYPRSEDRFNPPKYVDKGIKSTAQNPVLNFPGIQIMMTHGPPRDILDSTEHGNVGCESLIRAVSRAKLLLHCFGHIHEAYGAKFIEWKDDKTLIGPAAVEREVKIPNIYPSVSNRQIDFGEETLMINASIMNLQYQPTNSPWVVDLLLPKIGSELPYGSLT